MDEGYRFGEEGKYVLFKNREDIKKQNQVFELKIEFARKINYPYFLISFDGTAPIDAGTHSQIIKGIIGFCFARKKIDIETRGFMRSDSNIINELDLWDYSDYIRDFIIIPLKVENDRKYNYLKKINKRYEREITGKGFFYSITELIVPKISEILEPLKDSIVHHYNIPIRANEYTAIYEIKTERKEYVETVIVRTSLGPSVLELSWEISKTLAFKRALRK